MRPGSEQVGSGFPRPTPRTMRPKRGRRRSEARLLADPRRAPPPLGSELGTVDSSPPRGGFSSGGPGLLFRASLLRVAFTGRFPFQVFRGPGGLVLEAAPQNQRDGGRQGPGPKHLPGLEAVPPWGWGTRVLPASPMVATIWATEDLTGCGAGLARSVGDRRVGRGPPRLPHGTGSGLNLASRTLPTAAVDWQDADANPNAAVGRACDLPRVGLQL